MELKPGYKQTEAGIVPTDWEVVCLDDAAEFLDGRRRPVKDSDRAKMRGDIPYYGASGIVDYVNDFLFNEDLILLGEDGENILSRNCPLAFRVSGKTWVNNHAHVLRPRPTMCLGFLVEYLESLDYAQYNTGTAQPKLNKQVCSAIPVVRPPLPEQVAIAGALSDVDGLIGALDRLITKKRDLKQAVMQQLLTGRTRLPGFKGKWKLTKLGDHVTYLSHATYARAVLLTEGSVRYLHYGDIHAAPAIWLDPRATPMPFVPQRLAARFDRLEPGDLVFVDASEDLAGIGKSVELRGVEGREIIAGLHTITARFDKSVLADGFKGYLQFMPSFKAQLQRLATGTKVYASSKSHVSSVELELPGADEQAAIAEALNDMATEIAALEARRDKTRLLKQGMMKELLTGRIRLPLEEPMESMNRRLA